MAHGHSGWGSAVLTVISSRLRGQPCPLMVLMLVPRPCGVGAVLWAAGGIKVGKHTVAWCCHGAIGWVGSQGKVTLMSKAPVPCVAFLTLPSPTVAQSGGQCSCWLPEDQP